MRTIKSILSILQGNAVVIIKDNIHNASLIVGKNITKNYAVNSMVGAVKSLL